jgi:hypothetical protein
VTEMMINLDNNLAVIKTGRVAKNGLCWLAIAIMVEHFLRINRNI